VFDDDYIVMDPLYVEPPSENDSPDNNSDTLKAEKTSKFVYVIAALSHAVAHS
jgi:hypothetical protein